MDKWHAVVDHSGNIVTDGSWVARKRKARQSMTRGRVRATMR